MNTDSRSTVGDSRDSRDSRPTVTIKEAARHLGLTVDAVRSRLHRGTLEGLKVGNTWRVYLPAGETSQIENFEPTVGQPVATVDDSRSNDVLVEQLRDERDYLRMKLDQALEEAAQFRQQAAAERERADVLQREALERIEALTATAGSGSLASVASEASGSSRSADVDDQDAGDDVQNLHAQRGVWARLARWWKGEPTRA